MLLFCTYLHEELGNTCYHFIGEELSSNVKGKPKNWLSCILKFT